MRNKRCASRDLAANSHVVALVNVEKISVNAVFRVEALLPFPYFPARTPVGLRCSGLPQYAIPLRRFVLFSQ
jgi:hypothetical protein